MRSAVERAPNRSRARLVSRRRFLILGGSTSSLLLLVACQQSAAPPAPRASTQEPFVPRTREAINTPQATAAPAAAQPAPTPPASGQAAPVAVQPGPKGRFVEAWNTSLSPAWWDPQENPPQI